jgi:hypothetical protein
MALQKELFLIEVNLKEQFKDYKTKDELLIFLFADFHISESMVVELERVFKKLSRKFENFYLLANNDVYENDNNLVDKMHEGEINKKGILNLYNYFYFLKYNQTKLEKFKNIYVMVSSESHARIEGFNNMGLSFPEGAFENTKFWLNYIIPPELRYANITPSLGFKLKNVTQSETLSDTIESLENISFSGNVKLFNSIENSGSYFCLSCPWGYIADPVILDSILICNKDFLEKFLAKHIEIEYRIIYDIDKINAIFFQFKNDLILKQIGYNAEHPSIKSIVKEMKKYYMRYFTEESMKNNIFQREKYQAFPEYIVELLMKRRELYFQLCVEKELSGIFELLEYIKNRMNKKSKKPKLVETVRKDYTFNTLTEDIQHFIKLLNRQQIEFGKESLRSVLSFHTQKDIFKEADFITNLKEVKIRSDLTNVFPIIGLGVQFKRKININDIWDIQIEDIPKVHTIVDSLSLEAYQENKTLNMEEINGIIPLFLKEDSDIKQLVKTSLYHSNLSYLNTNNIKFSHKLLHFSLLANLSVHLLSQNTSDWMNKLLDQIFSTVDIVYGNSDFFRIYLKTLLKEPYKCFIFTGKGENILKGLPVNLNCEHLSKAVLLLSYSIRHIDILNKKFKKNVSPEFFENCYDLLLCEYIGRSFKLKQGLKEDYVKQITLRLDPNDKFFSRLNEIFDSSNLIKTYDNLGNSILHYRSLKGVRAKIIYNLYFEFLELDIRPIIDYLNSIPDLLIQESRYQLNLLKLKSIYSNLFGKPFPVNRDINNFIKFHSLRYTSSYERMSKYDSQKSFYEKDLLSYYKSFIYYIFADITDLDKKLESYFLEFTEEYNKIHLNEPLVLDLYENGKISKELLEAIKIHPLYLNSLNCCLCERCPLYLQIISKKELRDHRVSDLKHFTPLYKTVLLNLDKGGVFERLNKDDKLNQYSDQFNSIIEYLIKEYKKY